LGSDHPSWYEIQNLFDEIINQNSNLSNDQFLKFLIKSYTGDAVYTPLGNQMRTGKYQSIKGYLAAIIQNL
jgi:hypothetical protein